MPYLPATSSSQSVAIGAGSLSSSALAESQLYRLAATANCWVAFGAAPTAAAAAAGSHFIPAGGTMFVKMDSLGTAPKVAVIQEGAVTGNVSISLAADD